jgi:O-succinylbenzoic acid--CoA ligase
MMVVRALERGLKLITIAPSGHPLAQANSPLSFAAMVPLQVYNSLQVPEEKDRLKSIRHLIIGGGAIDDALAAELKSFPHAVWSTYGMTETLSHIALRRLSGPEASDWYTPLPSVTVSLSEEGTLVVNAPEVCATPFITNDIAELSSVNCQQSTVNCPSFRILGRKDNTICSGGLKIQAEELERQLRPHLSDPFLITKRPDPKFGEIVVLLTEGTTDNARQACEHVLPHFHQPRAYLHVARIPFTETGKPARHEAETLAKENSM